MQKINFICIHVISLTVRFPEQTVVAHALLAHGDVVRLLAASKGGGVRSNPSNLPTNLPAYEPAYEPTAVQSE